MFVTVGSALPFDRLISAVDDWAERAGRSDVFAQVGDSAYRPRCLRAVRFLTPEEFRSAVREASAVVSHAGMGTILTALELGKPLLLMPRLASRREHRSDHQLATARHFAERGALVAMGVEELGAKLDALERQSALPPIPPRASDALIGRIREFLGAA